MAVQNYVKMYVKNDGSLLFQDVDPIIGRSHLSTRQVLVTPWTLGTNEAIQVLYELMSGTPGPRRVMNEMGTEEVLINGSLETWNVYYYDITQAELNAVTSENTQTLKVQFRHIQDFGDEAPLKISLKFDLTVQNTISTSEQPIVIDDFDQLSIAIGNVDSSKLAKAFETFDDIGFVTGSELLALRIGNDNIKMTMAEFRDYVNAQTLTIGNEVNVVTSKFTTSNLNNGQVAINQDLKTTDDVTFNQVTVGTKPLNTSTVTALEDKYTVAQTDTLLDGKSNVGHPHTISDITDLGKGQPNGVASLDGTGRLPAAQLPIETVLFKGTFGSAGSTTGGDLPSSGVVIGDFYICDTDGFASIEAGLTFSNGDKAIYTGTAWSKIDNTETVTGVKGDEEIDFRIGNISLGFADVGAAPTIHDHVEADITDLDKYTQQEVDDALDLKSDVGHPHVEADITNLDKYTQAQVNSLLGNKSNVGHTHLEVDITDLDKYSQSETDDLLDLKSDVGHTHLEVDITDLDKYTQQEVDDALALKLNTSLKGAANGLAELGSDGKVPAGQLPSYVDDVLEFADLATFPTTGESDKIYVALDTNKVYRWSGSQYIEIAANEVNSVNGEVGVVVLDAGDIGVSAAAFDGILTTDDTDIQTALQTIDGHKHLEADITNLDKYSQAEVDSFLAEKADVASLSSTITLYPTTSEGDIAGYFTMVTDITDVRYNAVAFNVPTGAITTSNQLIASLATDPNIFVGNPGVINVNTIGNIRKTAGNQNAYANFYFEIYKRDSAGTETLLGTSDTTPVVNPEDLNVYQEFSAASILNNGSFLSTDRLVIKYYANAIDGTTSQYDFQFGGTSPVRTFLPVPVRVLQSAERIVYDNTGRIFITSTNLQGALDELDTVIEENTTVIKTQRYEIVQADNGAGGFVYDIGAGNVTGTKTNGIFEFPLQDEVKYIPGQNRLEAVVNNEFTYYFVDPELVEIDEDNFGVTYAFQDGDQVSVKIYQGLDSVSIEVGDGSITQAKLSTALNNKIDSYDSHIASVSNPHLVTAAQVGLGAVENYPVATTAEAEAGTSNVTYMTPLRTAEAILELSPPTDLTGYATETYVDGEITTLDGSLKNYADGVGTSTLASANSYTDQEIAALVATAPATLDTLNELAAALGDDPNFATTVTTAIGTKQETLVSGTNIKTVDGVSLLGSGDFDLSGTYQPLGDYLDAYREFVSVTATYTIQFEDTNKVLVCTNSTDIDIQIANNSTYAIPIGTTMMVLANGTGEVSIVALSGTTILGPTFLMKTQYSKASLIKIAENTWQVNVIAETETYSATEYDPVVETTDWSVATGDFANSYVAEIAVVGLEVGDNPFVDLDLSGEEAVTAQAIIPQFNKIFAWQVTDTDELTLYASDDITEDIKLHITMVK